MNYLRKLKEIKLLLLIRIYGIYYWTEQRRKKIIQFKG